MKRPLILLLSFVTTTLFAQDDLPRQARENVAEGKLLYRSEMASWYGTDLFLEHHKNRRDIGGYFSYTDSGFAKCVFFSNAAVPQVIGTIYFDSTYNTRTASIVLRERPLTSYENDLYVIRKKTMELLTEGDFYKSYEHTNPNLIPLIKGEEKKVYILTGPQENGVIIFGNDYLVTFDKNNNVVDKKSLHRNIISIDFQNKNDSTNVVGAMHSHLPETGDFITPTDVCTLMLYEKFANWEQHEVVSKNYLNIWNCKTNELTVMPMKTVNKILKDQEKKKRKSN